MLINTALVPSASTVIGRAPAENPLPKRALVVDTTELEGRLLARVRIPSEIYSRSTLTALKAGEKVSIGMQSLNPTKYLLQEGPAERVKLIEIGIAPGHHYTVELTFEAPLSQVDLIKNSKWIGLNGSGFYIQEYHIDTDRIVFKVHAGQKTRELSVFGSTAVVGQEFNLTPKIEDHLLEPQY